MKSIGNRPNKYLFHPFELAVSGYSGSGKTTLIAKLLERLSGSHRIGYVKHDAHRFEIDHPGKDTHRATASGAAAVLINDESHSATIEQGPLSLWRRRRTLADCDFVLAEGYKESPLPKLLVLDAEGKLERSYGEGTLSGVVALVGHPAGDPDVPVFDRDDIAGIADFIEHFMLNASSAPLHGLVLVGGRSSRMGRDKWSLRYGGQTQAERVMALLEPYCAEVRLSLREEQAEPELTAYPHLFDRFGDYGPLNGILTAMQEVRTAAWLVVACDLPRLDGRTIEQLVDSRNPLKAATAYRSASDGLPEPLCAIYEPRMYGRFLEAVGLDIACPRKILLNSSHAALELENRHALDNVNTPEELEEVMAAVGRGGAHASG